MDSAACFDKTEIRRTVRFWRGADGEKDNESLFDGLTNVGGESETTGLSVLGDELFEARFIDRHYAFEQPLDLFFIDVDAGDIDTKLGKTCAGYKTDITGTNYSNMHLATSCTLKSSCPDNQNLAGHAR